jgi:hypothetical protein
MKATIHQESSAREKVTVLTAKGPSDIKLHTNCLFPEAAEAEQRPGGVRGRKSQD